MKARLFKTEIFLPNRKSFVSKRVNHDLQVELPQYQRLTYDSLCFNKLWYDLLLFGEFTNIRTFA
jgi:hypothetical protein